MPKWLGDGDVTLIPKIDESITSEQIIASQMWLDNLYELLDVESPALKDRIVFYLANLPEELKSNFQAQAFGIADILGINEHSFLTSGLAQQVAGYLQTLPAEVETYLTLVATLPIDKLVGIADVENTLLTHFANLLDQQTLLALLAKQEEEPFILALVDLLAILDVDEALSKDAYEVIAKSLDDALGLTHYHRATANYILPASDIIAILDTGEVLERQIYFELNDAINIAIDRIGFYSSQYTLDLGGISISTGNLSGRISSAISSGISAGVSP